MTEQLEAGVRYLDFRIAHKANDPSMNLYFVHMVYTTVVVQVLSLPSEWLYAQCCLFDLRAITV